MEVEVDILEDSYVNKEREEDNKKRRVGSFQENGDTKRRHLTKNLVPTASSSASPPPPQRSPSPLPARSNDPDRTLSLTPSPRPRSHSSSLSARCRPGPSPPTTPPTSPPWPSEVVILFMSCYNNVGRSAWIFIPSCVWLFSWIICNHRVINNLRVRILPPKDVQLKHIWYLKLVSWILISYLIMD